MSNVLQEVLDEAEEEIREALENPEEFNFREDEREKIPVNAESSFVRSSVVDIGNENVEIRYSTHSTEVKYVAVINEENFSVIESNYVVRANDEVQSSKIYYLVTEDSTFMYERGSGWMEEFNPGPREVAGIAERLYEKALEEETEELDWGQDEEDYVPPPEEDELFTE